MNKTSRWIFCTLVGLLVTLFAYTAVHAQSNWDRNSERAAKNAQVQQAMQNASLAESIVDSRESAMGRSFDAGYRAKLKNSFALLPTKELDSLRYAGSEVSLGRKSIGDSSSDLVYTPVTPCRVFDTRYSAAGILAGGTQRNFEVSGTTGFPAQGGNSGGCGIPFGHATAVIINFAAVAPTGTGTLRAWAVADPQPPAPLAAVMNYSPAMWALGNGVAVPLCDPAATSCQAGDLRLQADTSSVHVVGDVVGYFRKLVLPEAIPMGSEKLPAFVTAAGGYQSPIATTDITLPHNGTCLVTCNLNIEAPTTNSSGSLIFNTARRDVAVETTEYDYGWAMNFPIPSQWGSASTTYTWIMTAGKTYRFGCWVGAIGDFRWETVQSNVSWICR
jgi:hypothetical protein